MVTNEVTDAGKCISSFETRLDRSDSNLRTESIAYKSLKMKLKKKFPQKQFLPLVLLYSIYLIL